MKLFYCPREIHNIVNNFLPSSQEIEKFKLAKSRRLVNDKLLRKCFRTRPLSMRFNVSAHKRIYIIKK